MARRPSLLRLAAIEMMLRCLRSDLDIDLLRPKFYSVSRQSWSNWVREAYRQFAAESETAVPPPPRPSTALDRRRPASPPGLQGAVRASAEFPPPQLPPDPDIEATALEALERIKNVVDAVAKALRNGDKESARRLTAALAPIVDPAKRTA